MSNLKKALAKLDADAQTHAENVLEATQLFAEGKLKQEDLDQAISERDASAKRREALLVAIQTEAAKGIDAEAAKAEAERRAAGERSLAILTDIESCAEDLDSSINTLVSTSLRFQELNEQFCSASRAAGLQADARNFLTNMAPVSSALARALAVSRLSEKFAPTVQLSGSHNAPVTVASITANRTGKLRAFIEKL